MAVNNFPFEIMEVPSKNEFVHVGPQKYRLPSGYREEYLKVYNMELRSDDVFVVTFPKSGTTWTQELVWLLCNNFDYDTAANKLLTERFPFLEFVMIFNPIVRLWVSENAAAPPEVMKNITKSVEVSMADVLAKAPSPRFIKTHLPFSLLPPGLLDTTKVVYVARDPRDVAVSYYHHCRLYRRIDNKCEFKTFWNMFIECGINWCPYFPHIKEAWAKRSHHNMLFLFYEDLFKDLPAVVKRVAKFLDKPVTEGQLEKLCEHLHIDNFRKNKSVNVEELQAIGFTSKSESFIRKGKAGGWRAYFDEEMRQQAERWMEENLRDTDLRFPSKD